jgi:Zn-finger nucleic acid-binding protein
MDCPRCSVELNEIARENGALQRCAECGGLWLGDVTDLNKILLHANLPALSSIPGFVNAEELTGPCPACNVDMVVVDNHEKRATESYDTCESCGGIWVDGINDEPAPTVDAKTADAEIVTFFRRFANNKAKK